MPASDDLAALAQAQAELVRSLTVGALPPQGFDPQIISTSVLSLQKKRLRTVARVWPQLAVELGDSYEAKFLSYAQRHALPRHGGPLADGRLFAQHLASSKELPEAGKWEAFVVDLHHVLRSDGLHPRRGFLLRPARFPQLRLIALAVKLPGLRGWLWTLRYGRLKPAV